MAETVRRPPRTLADALESRRAANAWPAPPRSWSSWTGALALPPRRLAKPELPLGGYADVTTRGGPEQILPSQFALDGLEFVRRFAEHELLHYRREEPHDRTREDIVVLLDQGVRTWGSVRLVLAAAAFALGRLAGARRVPFRIAATSAGGTIQDPLEMDDNSFAVLLEASDLSADPARPLGACHGGGRGAARRGVADAPAQPRRGGSAGGGANDPAGDAAVRGRRGRLRRRGVQRSPPRRRGAFEPLARGFEPHRPAAGAPPMPSHLRGPWRGDVETVPFPFVFGVADQGPFHFDFDGEGAWLVTATAGGILHATRTDGAVEAFPWW